LEFDSGNAYDEFLTQHWQCNFDERQLNATYFASRTALAADFTPKYPTLRHDTGGSRPMVLTLEI